MDQMYVIGEDAVSCALGACLVTKVLGMRLAQPAIDTGGVTKLQSNLHRYFGLANLAPVLCIADTDGGCAVQLLQRWLPAKPPSGFFLRLAIPEAESWLLADREGMSIFFGVAQAKVPPRPDALIDPKREVLKIALRSKRRIFRQEMVSPSDQTKQGAGYNLHLCDFVARHWDPERSLPNSPSLARAVQRLEHLRQR